MLHHVHLCPTDLGLNLPTVFHIAEHQRPASICRNVKASEVLSLLQPRQAKANPEFSLLEVFS